MSPPNIHSTTLTQISTVEVPKWGLLYSGKRKQKYCLEDGHVPMALRVGARHVSRWRNRNSSWTNRKAVTDRILSTQLPSTNHIWYPCPCHVSVFAWYLLPKLKNSNNFLKKKILRASSSWRIVKKGLERNPHAWGEQTTKPNQRFPLQFLWIFFRFLFPNSVILHEISSSGQFQFFVCLVS